MPLAEQRGGAELCLLTLLAARPRPADWVIVFLQSGSMVEQARAHGAIAHVVEAGQLRHVHRLIATVIAIAGIARREQVEVIVGWMTKGHLYGGLASLLAGVPAFWFEHGMPTNIFDRLATLLPSRRILTCSKTVAAAQVRLWPSRPMVTVYPPVNLEQFNPEALPSMSTVRDQLGLPQDVTIVGVVGRLQRWKGIHVLIEAMPAILHSHPNTLCVVVGGAHSLEPDYPDYLAQQIQALGLGDQVRMVGLKSNVPEWMQAMDVVVHASDHEPFGMVVIEAMALGKPVVAGAQGGPTEIITSGVDGLLVEYGDTKNLAVAVLRYLQDERYAQTVGQAASLRAADFSVNCYAQAFTSAVQL